MRRLLLGLTLLTLLIVGFVALAWWKAWWNTPVHNPQAVTVIIESGSSAAQVAAQLNRAGLIANPRLWLATLNVTGKAGKLQAGEYAFPPDSSPHDIAVKLERGEVVVHKLTIPEGLTSAEVAALLRQHEALTGTVPTIKEGTLLPETYHFTRGHTRAALVASMQKAKQAVLQELWPRRQPGLPLATPQEALILASIVEKETGVVSERPLVAGVFINRLRLGMRLQSDPTTIYALTRGQRDLGRPLLLKDLSTVSPYNTYVVKGLPPTPIANAGRASIAAVLQPQPTDALYFVADGTGGHRFARTLAEHNRNVAAYRVWARTQKTQTP